MGRRAKADGIGAQKLLGRAPGHHRRTGIRRHDAEARGVRHLQRVIGRHAEVVAIVDSYRADAILPREANRQLRGIRADRYAEPVIAVYQRGGGALTLHVDVGGGVDDTVAYALHQGGKAGDAMRFDAPQVAEHKMPRRLRGIFRRDARLHEHVPGKSLQARRGNTLSGWRGMRAVPGRARAFPSRVRALPGRAHAPATSTLASSSSGLTTAV